MIDVDTLPKPFGVDVPISLLKNNELTIEEANEILEKHLSKKKIKKQYGGTKLSELESEEFRYAFQ